VIENTTKAIEKRKEDIPSLMLPLSRRVLLVPTVSVAEIVHYKKPEPINESPAWLLGQLQWRDLDVPLLSLEILNGEANPGINALTRVAVFNGSSEGDELNFYAIVTQGTPKLSRITEDDVSICENSELGPYETMAVTVEEEEQRIPDLVAIERAYLSWLNQ